MPPDIPARLQAQPNFRDLGGIETVDGKRVRPGQIFRSGELGRLDTRDIETLEALGVRTIVDLRADVEVTERGADIELHGADVQRIPIDEANRLATMLRKRFDLDDFSDPGADLMLDVYRALAADWRHAYARFMYLVVSAPRPLVFHCTHGKDRAGFGAALVLTSLGVSWQAVEADYLLSNVCRRAENEAQLEQVLEAVRSRSESPPDLLDLDWLRGLFYVEPAYLRAARRKIEDEYGDIEGYIRVGLGVDNRSIARLRDELLEPSESGAADAV